MHVVATAGHVDHGKSALIKALTGMEPDRWAAEQSRGMSIDLGFCWMTRDGESIAFVDVPGHERFLSNALAGVGCCEAVILVVAADEGWMPQTFEHLDALNALGIQAGVVAVSRSDLAEPGPVLAETRERLAGTSLASIPAVAVSAVTGQGLEDLLAALTPQLVAAPLGAAPARMWIDRSFSVRGAGTVVTGALCSGQITNGDSLFVPRLGRQLEIRGLHCLGEPIGQAAAFSRVAINLRRVPAEALHRGDALVTPEHWLAVTSVDVRVHEAAQLPREILVHVGTAKVTAMQRKLGDDTIRLRLSTPLPLHIGDRLALRAAGSRSIVGATVLDPEPAPLAGRGAAARRGQELAAAAGSAGDGAAALRLRKIASTAMLTAIGVTPPGDPVTGDWHIHPAYAVALRDLIDRQVTAADALHRAISVEAIQHRLGLPDAAMVAWLLPDSVQLDRGELRPVMRHPLPAPTLRALNLLPARVVEASDIAQVGLHRPGVNGAIEHGLLVRVGGAFMLRSAMTQAIEVLAGLDQPFTVSQARQALGASRKHTLMLLEHLDATRVTQSQADRTRRVAGRQTHDLEQG